MKTMRAKITLTSILLLLMGCGGVGGVFYGYSEMSPERIFPEAVCISAGILLVLILLACLIAGCLTKDLAKLNRAAKAIADGNLETSLFSSKKDEVGQLSDSMQRMIVEMKNDVSFMTGLAYKDALTSVKNLAAFEDYSKKLDSEIQPGMRGEYSVVSFDINHLDEMNKKHGTEMGDAYLVNCCRLICKIFAHSPVFRVGGDEFVTILRDSDYGNRTRLLALFRTQVSKSVHENDNIVDRMSIASGMAEYQNGTDHCVKDVYLRATNKMLENKKEMEN